MNGFGGKKFCVAAMHGGGGAGGQPAFGGGGGPKDPWEVRFFLLDFFSPKRSPGRVVICKVYLSWV